MKLPEFYFYAPNFPAERIYLFQNVLMSKLLEGDEREFFLNTALSIFDEDCPV